jgi:hypothetical protein
LVAALFSLNDTFAHAHKVRLKLKLSTSFMPVLRFKTLSCRLRFYPWRPAAPQKLGIEICKGEGSSIEDRHLVSFAHPRLAKPGQPGRKVRELLRDSVRNLVLGTGMECAEHLFDSCYWQTATLQPLYRREAADSIKQTLNPCATARTPVILEHDNVRKIVPYEF